MVNYSKWDNIDDSDDEEQPAPQPPVSGKAVSSPGSSNEEKQTATVERPGIGALLRPCFGPASALLRPCFGQNGATV